MLKLIGEVVSLLNYARKIVPSIIAFIKSERDRVAIEKLKNAKTEEERARAAKDLFDRSRS